MYIVNTYVEILRISIIYYYICIEYSISMYMSLHTDSYIHSGAGTHRIEARG
jgi:hypothetical protein